MNKTTTNIDKKLIEWQYEFRGKRYGCAIGKGDTDGVTDTELMHGYIDMMAKNMHETLDKIVEDSKKAKQAAYRRSIR